MKRRWTKEEKSLLKDIYEDNTSDKVAVILGRTPKAVRILAHLYLERIWCYDV